MSLKNVIKPSYCLCLETNTGNGLPTFYKCSTGINNK